MENPIVACSVDQCAHNFQGKQCMAATVRIYNNGETATSKSSSDTECRDFDNSKTVGQMVEALGNANVGGTMMAPFKDGVQMTPRVECFVHDCKYWEKNNLCTAGNIQVNGFNAARPEDTDCKTFEPK